MPKIKPVPKSKRTQIHWTELNKVIDPELNMGIVDLGLVYDIKTDRKKNCTVYMTLTTPACPYGPIVIQQVYDRLRLDENLKNINVEIVWDPAWKREMIDPDIRELMFDF